MNKRLAKVLVALTALALVFVGAANFFPDRTWTFLEAARNSVILVGRFVNHLQHRSAASYSKQLVSPVAVPVMEVVANPQHFSHTVVIVQGCYVSSFERSTFQPCIQAKHGEMIWVEDADFLFETSKMRLPMPSPVAPAELRGQTTREPDIFLFKYNPARSRAAWAKLADSLPTVPVTLTGQFDTVPPNKAQDDRYIGEGFGHLGQYQHRLILVDVLSSPP